MEFLLQWLDEIDDMASMLLLRWERMRPWLLLSGLIAGVLLHGDRIGLEPGLPLSLFAGIAAMSVLVWSVLTLFSLAVERKISSMA